MSDTLELVDYYGLLGIAETADGDAVKRAIREQRRTWNKRAAQSDPVKRAQAERRVRDLAEAERVLLDPSKRRRFDEEIRTARPRSVEPAGPNDERRDWIVEARRYFEQNNAHSAYYAAREAILVNGADHEAWSIRANSSFLMGKYGDAEFEFNEAIRLQPNNAVYHFDLAEAYAVRGHLDTALTEYEIALRLEPGNPLYRTAIANIYIHKGAPDKALELMELVVAEHADVEFFQYYLALALHDVNLTRWSRTRSGTYIITSPAQISVTKEMSGRALKLKYDDSALRASLTENLQLAARAEEVKFFHSGLGGWATGVLIGLFLIAYHGLGLLIIAGLVALYVALHRMPVWKHNAKQLGISHHGI
jgi:Tfp pilus assembly protein PilF